MFNLPNLLTMFRLLMVPCFFAALYYHLIGYPYLIWAARAIILFIVASDMLDGYLARRWNITSAFGKILDPLADKCFVTCSYILLSVFQQIPAWLTIIVVAKDLFTVFGWGALALLYHHREIAPSLWGKLATGFQCGTLCVLIFFPGVYYLLRVLMIVTAGFTITALLHYAYQGLLITANGNTHEKR